MASLGRQKLADHMPNHPFAHTTIHFGMKRPAPPKDQSAEPQSEPPKQESVDQADGESTTAPSPSDE